MKGIALQLAMLTAGVIAGGIVNETVKSSLEIEDAAISGALTAGGVFATAKTTGSLKNVLLGATIASAVSTVSDGVNLLAQKTNNPMIDKVSELLPSIKATNLLANISKTPELPQPSPAEPDENTGTGGLGYLDYDNDYEDNYYGSELVIA